jgi:ATPase subunit of ABC transporter with duplicated ATPase domains
MGTIDVQRVSYWLPDGRALLNDVSFKVGDGQKVAFIGANGAGKTTLMRLMWGELEVEEGSIVCQGSLGVMRQFVGHMSQGTVRDLLLTVAPPAIREAGLRLERTELAMMDRDDEKTQMAYAQALADWGDVGGYDMEVTWDLVTSASLDLPFERAQYREAGTLSGGEQKRLVLEALLRGPDEILMLDEPDNYLDVPGKRWLEEQIRDTRKTVAFISHDRELLAATATHIVTVELGAAGNTTWTHGGGFHSYLQAREDRNSRFEELRKRWEEEHDKLKTLVRTMRQWASNSEAMASRYHAAMTRLARFEEAGPPQAIPLQQNVTMRLGGARTGKRAVVIEDLELTGLTKPFSSEFWFGDRVAVLGANGTGKSHFLRLLAAGGSDPDVEHRPVGDTVIDPVVHRGVARLGARVRAGWFAQTHHHPELQERTLIDILQHGDKHRSGMSREFAGRILGRYALAHAAEQRFASLSGGQQARFQICLLELSGATLLLLDEPTDNLDLDSAEALEQGLAAFEGTVVAVTHDRWFARNFDRFLVFRSDNEVVESTEPVWDERRGMALRPRP